MNPTKTEIYFESMTKAEKYEYAIVSIQGLCNAETNLISNMANITAVLKEVFQWWWVGFYIVSNNQLVLGPFQGPAACTRISKGKGVCGTAWEQNQSIIVPDVDLFPGHIACSAASRSEIVIPLNQKGETIGVLDVDSTKLSDFDLEDQQGLEKICAILSAVME